MSRGRTGFVAGAVVLVAVVVTLVLHHHDRASATTPDSAGASTHPLPAVPGAVTVVGLGDSVMAGSHCGCSGVTAQYAAGWSMQIHRAVRSVNLGISGDTTSALQQRLATDAVTRADVSRAQVVLVIEGANDLVPQLETWREDTCPASCYLPAVRSMGSRLATALADIRRLAPAGAQVLVAGYWNVFPDGAAARADGGQSEIDWSREITRAADAAIEQAAVPQQVTYVDLTPSFLAQGTKDPTPLLAADGDHPNAAGVRAIVADLLRVTKPLS